MPRQRMKQTADDDRGGPLALFLPGSFIVDLYSDLCRRDSFKRSNHHEVFGTINVKSLISFCSIALCFILLILNCTFVTDRFSAGWCSDCCQLQGSGRG